MPAKGKSKGIKGKSKAGKGKGPGVGPTALIGTMDDCLLYVMSGEGPIAELIQGDATARQISSVHDWGDDLANLDPDNNNIAIFTRALLLAEETASIERLSLTVNIASVVGQSGARINIRRSNSTTARPTTRPNTPPPRSSGSSTDAGPDRPASFAGRRDVVNDQASLYSDDAPNDPAEFGVADWDDALRRQYNDGVEAPPGIPSQSEDVTTIADAREAYIQRGPEYTQPPGVVGDMPLSLNLRG